MAAKPKAKPRPKGAKSTGKSCATRASTGRSLHAVPINPGSAWARRGREVYQAVLSDLGGQQLQSELALQTIRRVTGLIVIAEQAEAKLAAGEAVELSEHIAVINAFNRTAGALGLARKPKDVQTLEQYLAANYAQQPQEADEAEEVEEGAEDE
jgi:hypothetical protein